MFPAYLKLELFISVPERLILAPNINSSTRIIINPNPMFSKKLFIFIILINILR